MPDTAVPRGTYGVLITPFRENGELDERALQCELAHCLSTTATGLLINGSSSEFIYMSPEQNKRVLEVSMRTCGAKKVLLGGANAPTEGRVLDYLAFLSDCGYRYGVVCPPYYYPQTDEDICAFYTAVLEKAPKGLRILAYNIPFCAPLIPLNILPRLMERPNFAGLKDSSGDMPYLSKLMSLVDAYRPDFSVFCGQDSALLPSLTVGVQGDISSLAWILDKPISELLRCYDAGDYARAEELQRTVTRLAYHLDQIAFPENYRALADAMGFDCGIPQRSIPSLGASKLNGWKEVARTISEKLMAL